MNNKRNKARNVCGPELAEPSSFKALKVAITGGTSGLGLALVREFITRGDHVGFVARNRDKVREVVTSLPGARGIVGDVSRKDEIYRIAVQLIGVLGGVDVLINNASALGPIPLAPLADTECEDLETALLTNVTGPFRLTKALLGSLAASAREGRGALIVNISSDAAVNAYPNWGAYGASKAALHQLTRIWDEELANGGIRFLSFDPGDMDTPLHELAVPGADRSQLKQPEEAAKELVAIVLEVVGTAPDIRYRREAKQ